MTETEASDTRFADAPADEVGRLVQAFREALTDSMVERLSSVAGTTLELLDRLGDERTGAAVHSLLDRLVELHQVGALDTLCDLAMLVHAARSAATDSIVERLFAVVEQMVGTFASDGMASAAENAVQSLNEAAAASSRPASRNGILAGLSFLGKPETQRALSFLVAFGDKLRQRTIQR
ncbi:MAG TPA: hypothetical protein VMU87_08640 [Stellaceae bacterium]|nr:hypothetical protein [Stellaceae bacterium]